MMDAQKRRCLQALNLSVWHPVSKQNNPQWHFIPASTLLAGAVLFVLNDCPLSKRAEVIALLQNIAFYLNLGAQQYSVVFVAEASDESMSSERVLAAVQPAKIILFGKSIEPAFAEQNYPTHCSIDLCEVLAAPVLKKHILKDLAGVRQVV